MKTLPLVVAAAVTIAAAGLAHAATFSKQTSLSRTALPTLDPSIGYNATKSSEEGLQIIATASVRSKLLVDGDKLDIAGRTSLHLSADPKQVADGLVEVRGLNVAYFDVPQNVLSGDLKDAPQTGVLGFAAHDGGYPQYLKYDQRSGRLSGDITGYVDAAFMAVLGRLEGDDKGDEDMYETPTQLATLSVSLYLEDSLATLQKKAEGGKEVLSAGASMSMRMQVEADDRYALPRYRLETPIYELVFEYTPILWFEVAKRLCVQPVRIGRISSVSGWPPSFIVDYTGDGLAFGLPEAKNQWAKADVVFNVKDWITLWKPGYWEMDTAGSSTSTEEGNLLDEVDDDQCVEVYFIDDFDPESAHGGGATWGSGTASTKIITSDGNARGGIDETHLAHELGHSMGLRHPSSSATASAEPGSTGTLMCPSGWMNDNPKVNSQENKDKLSNPLFTFAIKVKSAGPDCTDSADCGVCF